MTIKLLTIHLLDDLTLIGGCTCSSESTLIKMPHSWKSSVTAQIECVSSVISLTLQKWGNIVMAFYDNN